MQSKSLFQFDPVAGCRSVFSQRAVVSGISEGIVGVVCTAAVLLGCQSRAEPSPSVIRPKQSGVESAPSSSSSAVLEKSMTSRVGRFRRLGTVDVDPSPYCAQAEPLRAQTSGKTWLSDDTIQSRVATLNTELQGNAASLVGIDFDNERRIAVVVFHQDFDAYAEIQRRLSERMSPLVVELRAACRPRSEIDEALNVLKARDWHPRAKQTPLGWHLDAAFSGYVVTVDDSAPEVAATLEAKLKDAVFVRLGKPRRHSLAQ